MTITRCLWMYFVTVTSSLGTWRHLKGANFRALYLRNCTSDLVRPRYVGTPGSVIDENGGHVQMTSLRHHVTCDVVLKVQHEYVLGISQWLTQNVSYTWQNETPLCLYRCFAYTIHLLFLLFFFFFFVFCFFLPLGVSHTLFFKSHRFTHVFFLQGTFAIISIPTDFILGIHLDDHLRMPAASGRVMTSSKVTWRHTKGANFRAPFLRNCRSDLVRTWYASIPGSVIDENQGHVVMTSSRDFIWIMHIFDRMSISRERNVIISQFLLYNVR